MLFGCGNKMWVPLLGQWGVVSYAPILVCRQYAAEQFIPTTHRLNQLEFAYWDPGYAAQLAELSKFGLNLNERRLHDTAMTLP